VTSEPTTNDPIPPAQLAEEVARLFTTLAAGGVGIVPLNVAYAIVAAREGGIRRIFAAKQRSYDKPSGLFGNWRMSRELHVLPPERHAMVRTISEEDSLPLSVVAPFRADHDLLGGVDPFVLQHSTKAGTLDMLLNAGQFHDAIAAESLARGMPVFGSSANQSLTGSKFRYSDIEPTVREAADVHFDHGVSLFANPHGWSSTIIDFRDFRVLRVGVCFDRLQEAFAARFGVTLVMP